MMTIYNGNRHTPVGVTGTAENQHHKGGGGWGEGERERGRWREGVREMEREREIHDSIMYFVSCYKHYSILGVDAILTPCTE